MIRTRARQTAILSRQIIQIAYGLSLLFVSGSGYPLPHIVEIESPTKEIGGVFGYTVTSLSDQNQDGISDFAVSSHIASKNGRVDVFNGKDLRPIYSLTHPDSPTSRSAILGIELTSLPDLNADGFGELLVGCSDWLRDSSATITNGKAFVFSGPSLLHELEPPSLVPFTEFGYQLSGIPDVNGDDITDILVGAPRENEDWSGRVYVFDGKTGDRLWGLNPAVQVEDGHFGSEIKGIEDINGNGSGEAIILGFSETPYDRHLFVLDGLTGEEIYAIRHPSHPDVNRFHGFEDLVTCLTDIDGDDITDYVVQGSFSPHTTISPWPQAFFVFSGKTGKVINLINIPREEEEYDEFNAITQVSDLDHDGIPELLAAKYLISLVVDPIKSGRVNLLNGLTGEVIESLWSPNQQKNGRFGESVANLGDVNLDGLDDFLIGAPGESEGEIIFSGRAYLYYSPFASRSDLNRDGNINDTDLLIFMQDWGKVSGP